MFPNLLEVVGMELCATRFKVGEAALKRLALRRPHAFEITLCTPDEVVLATVGVSCLCVCLPAP
jgi:hypothetical protein